MFVCLSSASRPGYSADLNRVLSVPNGYEIKFRYDYKWISKEIVEQLEKGLNGTGQKCLICFIDGSTKGKGRIIPGRIAQIVAITKFSHYVTITFSVNDYASTDNISTFNSNMLTQHKNIPKLNDDDLVGDFWFEVPDSDYTSCSGEEGWSRVVDEYYKLPSPNQDTPLYMFNYIKCVENQRQLTPSKKHGGISFDFQAGKNYEISFNHYHPESDFSGTSICVENSSDGIVWKSPQKQSLNTRYDQKIFKFTSEISLHEKNGLLSIYRETLEAPSNIIKNEDSFFSYEVRSSTPHIFYYFIFSAVAFLIPFGFAAFRFKELPFWETLIVAFIGGIVLSISNLIKDRHK